MRILVTGARNWEDLDTARSGLLQAARLTGATLLDLSEIILVHGGAGGFDLVCAGIAEELGWETEEHKAAWHPLGERGRPDNLAGHKRNQLMVDLGADMLVAGIMPCQKGRYCPVPKPHPSHGTMDCVGRALLAGIGLLPLREGICETGN